MAQVFVETSYGTVGITDVMIDIDGTNLEEGVEMRDEIGYLICETVVYSTSDLENNPGLVEELINSLC